MSKRATTKTTGKRPLTSQSASLTAPVTDTTKRLTELLDGPKKKRRLKDTRKPGIGQKNNSNSNAPAAKASQRWSHLSSTASKPIGGEKAGGLGGVTLSSAPGFRKATSHRFAQAAAARKNEAKRNPYQNARSIAPVPKERAASTLVKAVPVSRAKENLKLAPTLNESVQPTFMSNQKTAPTLKESAEPTFKPSVSLLASKSSRGTKRTSSWTRPAGIPGAPVSVSIANPLPNIEAAPVDAPTKGSDTAACAAALLAPRTTAPSIERGPDAAPVVAKPKPKVLRPLRALSAMGPIPTPSTLAAADPSQSFGASGATAGKTSNRPTKQKASAGNFVRQNLRNGAGACRGARNKGKKSKWQLKKEERQKEWKNNQDKRPFGDKRNVLRGSREGAPPSQSGIDPMDDFLDGTFKAPSKARASREAIPKCPGHQRPCKLLTVKKATTGNKGRQFYTCSLPRGEQCNHFLWADDTAEATQRALLKNSSHSGFIARQVASYMERMKVLTVPELRVVCEKRGLDTAGKKQQLLTRMSIWVRDEVADGSKEFEPEEDAASLSEGKVTESSDPMEKVDTAQAEESSDDDDDLDLFGDQPDGKSQASKPSEGDEEGSSMPEGKAAEGSDPMEKVDTAEAEESSDDEDGDTSDVSSDEGLELVGDQPPGKPPASKRSDGCEEKQGSDPMEIMDTAEAEDSSDDEDNYASDASSDEELELVGNQPRGKPLLSKPTTGRAATNGSEACSTEDSTEAKANSCPLRSTLQVLFGHNEFREAQEWTVRRCLNKERTLLVAPTGFGKSLCYALPSALLDGICIVVSPLLSLIQDQLRVLPPRLPAATLSGPVTTANMAATLDDVVRGRLKVLFVSPERLTSASFRRLFIPRWNPETRVKERHFPTVALLCVDEAHCMSQWAHNFRPSYLRMRAMMELIQPQSVLAITATAGPRVVKDICRTLGISGSAGVSTSVPGSIQQREDTGGVRVMASDRDNIDVTCLILSNQEKRLSKLMKVLVKAKVKTNPKGEPKAETVIEDGCLATGSVIVYVWRQRDAEAVAENIQASGVDGGVVVYHGGMDSGARSRSQSQFMRGKARICVATVAFGLGINKADVAGVIHMYLSASPEHYLQEIGRAGRDGRPAKAIALVLSEEVLVRHSLAHSDLISKSQIRMLLSVLDTRVKDALASLPKERPEYGPIHFALPLEKSVLDCDCKPETVETLVSILEQREGKESVVRMEGTSYDHATIAPKRRSLAELATMEDVAKAILTSGTCIEAPAGEKLENASAEPEESTGRRKLVGSTYGSYKFSVTECANHLGPTAEPRHVFAALRRLQSSGEIELDLDTSSSGRALHMKLMLEGLAVFSDDNEAALDELADDILDRFASSVTYGTNKVLDLNNILQQVSKAPANVDDQPDSEKSASLELFQSLIHQYFEAEGEGRSLTTDPDDLPEFSDVSNRELSMDISSVLSYLLELQGSAEGPKLLKLDDPRYSDYAALAITKFLHGIAPVGMTLTVLRRHALFGRMQSTRFSLLLEAVARLLGPYKPL